MYFPFSWRLWQRGNWKVHTCKLEVAHCAWWWNLGDGEVPAWHVEEHHVDACATPYIFFQDRNKESSKALFTQDAQRDAKQMELVCPNRSVHTARKQHQRVCVWIRARASGVDEAYTNLERGCLGQHWRPHPGAPRRSSGLVYQRFSFHSSNKAWSSTAHEKMVVRRVRIRVQVSPLPGPKSKKHFPTQQNTALFATQAENYFPRKKHRNRLVLKLFLTRPHKH